MDPVKIVAEMYQAFGRGDVPAVLAHLAEDVVWEYGVQSTEVPWLMNRKGREGAGAFFASLAAVEFHRFAPKTILGGDGMAVSLVDVEFTVKATGKRVVEEDEAHVWYFNPRGQVIRFRHRADTHQHLTAYRG